jgi:Lhr-like helicase
LITNEEIFCANSASPYFAAWNEKIWRDIHDEAYSVYNRKKSPFILSTVKLKVQNTYDVVYSVHVYKHLQFLKIYNLIKQVPMNWNWQGTKV